ncbi:MAG: CBS domain-containing protein [Saprospiraceae bacterium]|nr:CBS domain-containing protein [Saprospiraceae bacterium]HRD82184.1 glutamate-cysteine ligase family protein [Saprospiraceae bacterium]
MGEQKVSVAQEGTGMQSFVRSLLRDVQALEYMLENDWFEKDIIRIGAEQEMCLVDAGTYKPACINMEVLEKLSQYPWVVTELAKFNLEVNLSPREFTGKCLREMDHENREYLNIIRRQLKHWNAEVCLTGILPTLRKPDLDLSNLTPKPRYFALMEALNSQMLGSAFELRLSGIDELLVKHDSPLLEACNTSFQVHLQVSPDLFVPMYNMAQALAAPVMAISANSPIVFGKRLWHESRIALFQQALDVRTTHDHMRERSPRVSFGTGWLEGSLLEIYKEDIARFRVLLAGDVDEDSIEAIQAGRTPKLRALQVHNSTVYRWNRPCYGISPNGQPHLRIENRVIPAGPTTTDAAANAAFWLGAMIGMGHEYKDIRNHVSWEDVRDNFMKAAQFGIDSHFNWFHDKKLSACDLVLHELLPMARKGLQMRGVIKQDIDKYLGIIEQRARDHMNGARWQLRTFTKLAKECTRDEAVTAMTAAIVHNQWKDIPVHQWTMPAFSDLPNYHPSKLRVEEFMETDLFTVQKDDLIELVTDLMDWRKIRYMPVEESKGQLCGLITSRLLLRHFARKNKLNSKEATMVKDIMIEAPITISPNATLLEAMNLMREKRIGCLPVVQNDELIGIITEMDFLRISTRLIEQLEK